MSTDQYKWNWTFEQGCMGSNPILTTLLNSYVTWDQFLICSVLISKMGIKEYLLCRLFYKLNLSTYRKDLRVVLDIN